MAPGRLWQDRMVRGWLGLLGLSVAGDELWTIALAWTAVHVASPAAAGLVVAAGTIPRALVLLLGGAVADRYDARMVMIGANAVRIAVLVLVAARIATTAEPSLGLLITAAVAFGVADAVYSPSQGTVGRQLVRPIDLPAYTGAAQTLHRLGSMGGAALGGFVVAAWGLGGSALLDALTFAVVALYLAGRLRARYPLPRGTAEPVLRSIRQGFLHLRDAPVTRTLVLAMSGLNMFAGPAEGIGLALRSREEGWGAETVGLFLALLGVGAALGSVAMLRWHPRFPAAVSFAWLAVQGGAIVVLGVGPQWLVGTGAFVIGVTAGIASVLLSALFQATVDGGFLGRMSALQRLGDDVTMPFSMIGFGALASAMTVGAAFTAYGVAMTLLSLLPLRHRGLRCMTSG